MNLPPTDGLDVQRWVAGLSNDQLAALSSEIYSEMTRRANLKAPTMPAMNADELALVNRKSRAKAIMQYRTRIGCSLSEAKAAVDYQIDHTFVPQIVNHVGTSTKELL